MRDTVWQRLRALVRMERSAQTAEKRNRGESRARGGRRAGTGARGPKAATRPAKGPWFCPRGAGRSGIAGTVAAGLKTPRVGQSPPGGLLPRARHPPACSASRPGSCWSSCSCRSIRPALVRGVSQGLPVLLSLTSPAWLPNVGNWDGFYYVSLHLFS